MSHTHAQNVVHVVFGTKERRTTLPEKLQPGLWAYVAEICRGTSARLAQ